MTTVPERDRRAGRRRADVDRRRAAAHRQRRNLRCHPSGQRTGCGPPTAPSRTWGPLVRPGGRSTNRGLVAGRRVQVPLPDPAARRTGTSQGAPAPGADHLGGGLPGTVTGSQIESPIAEVSTGPTTTPQLRVPGGHRPARHPDGAGPAQSCTTSRGRSAPSPRGTCRSTSALAETVPALMAGNTVVLKPAQLTPWSGTELGRIVAEETDIPGRVVGNSNDVGAALSADPRVDMITFTRIPATGRAIRRPTRPRSKDPAPRSSAASPPTSCSTMPTSIRPAHRGHDGVW